MSFGRSAAERQAASWAAAFRARGALLLPVNERHLVDSDVVEPDSAASLGVADGDTGNEGSDAGQGDTVSSGSGAAGVGPARQSSKFAAAMATPRLAAPSVGCRRALCHDSLLAPAFLLPWLLASSRRVVLSDVVRIASATVTSRPPMNIPLRLMADCIAAAVENSTSPYVAPSVAPP